MRAVRPLTSRVGAAGRLVWRRMWEVLEESSAKVCVACSLAVVFLTAMLTLMVRVAAGAVQPEARAGSPGLAACLPARALRSCSSDRGRGGSRARG
eukprot:1723292-Rhodomonas_salina.3